MKNSKKILFTLLFIFSLSFSLFATDSIDADIAENTVKCEETNWEAIGPNALQPTAEQAFSIDEKRSYDPNQDYTFGLIPTEKLNINFSSHAYLETAMLYGYPTVGVTMDFGLNVDTVTIAAYLRYHHFFRPLGSSSGLLYIGEELGEVGLSFKVRIYELGRFNVNIGINTGWYQQWLMYHSSGNTYNLMNNGMMIRPEASIGWNWIGWWTMELGLFYQTPLYPTYEGYQGWGLYVKIL